MYLKYLFYFLFVLSLSNILLCNFVVIISCISQSTICHEYGDDMGGHAVTCEYRFLRSIGWGQTEKFNCVKNHEHILGHTLLAHFYDIQVRTHTHKIIQISWIVFPGLVQCNKHTWKNNKWIIQPTQTDILKQTNMQITNTKI